MAKYLTNKETQASLEKLIMNSEKKLILISPYLKLTSSLKARIKTAAEKGVSIKFVYRKDCVKKAELDSVRSIKNIELKSTEDLHAKCYFNEKEMIITSLNLLDSSEKNWEMGVLIDRVQDKDIFDAALTDCLTIFNNSESSEISRKLKLHQEKAKEVNPKKGYCIRCKETIRFDMNKPYCRECFYEWEFWSNESYKESVCHCCGEGEPTLRLKPVCYDCYRTINQPSH